eukprot:CAMPEP_0184864338 /NCGR_PEP_ID=MMETSP0580-20130426/14552_1 /TAXON_ID=1118495 /ORGANISM="Dactyliosolen fragilissimus" /LENGTH=909 /DNA_ID=CAMNT_0027363069 /DNA_START=104 /DNA_END=2833 /DNA_ORIENTATION=-
MMDNYKETSTSETKPASQLKSTRVCIKNIPPSLDESTLRRHLEDNLPSSSCMKAGLVITDCKMPKTKDGKRRGLAFVGFKNHEMAKEVISYFDNTFARTSRLSVQMAFSKSGVGMDQKQQDYRPWSRHSVGSSRYDKLHSSKDKKNINIKEEKVPSVKERIDKLTDKKLGKHLNVVQKDKNAQFWSNDDEFVPPSHENHELSDKEEVINGSSLKSGEIVENTESGVHISKQEIIDSNSGGDVADMPVQSSKKRDKDKKDVVITDMDFLRSKVVSKEALVSDDEIDSAHSNGDSSSSLPSSSSNDSTDGSEIENEKNEERKDDNNKHADENNISGTESLKNENDLEPDRLFIRNLPFSATESEILNIFASYGTVSEFHIPVDDTNRNKGYAFVRFDNKNDAKIAMDALDGVDFQGRLIHVLPARKAPDTTDNLNLNKGDETYKSINLRRKKEEVEKSSNEWSSNFIRSDAVIDNLSDRFGLSKGIVMDVKGDLSSGGAAVRLALGETHILDENKAFFEENGINISMMIPSLESMKTSSNDKLQRSELMIIIKNLPYNTSYEEMVKLFHIVGCNDPKRILLSPSKTICVVEYKSKADAKKTFRKLAYKRFKHVPLYLEWAPLSAIKTDASVDSRVKGGNDETTSRKQNGEVPKETYSELNTNSTRAIHDSGENVESIVGTCSIYVKNLNFCTTEEKLREFFEAAVGKSTILVVRIPKKFAAIEHLETNSVGAQKVNKMSMGYGFVECVNENDARRTIQKLTGKSLDGHILQLSLSSSRGSSKTNLSSSHISHSKNNNTKLVVRNVAFQCSRGELLQLFGSFGQLKKVRLPKKIDGGHRGFAFVEFISAKEAAAAFSALSRTHLYGRHLVIEWAEDKDDVNFSREKAKRDFDQLNELRTDSRLKEVRKRTLN